MDDEAALDGPLAALRGELDSTQGGSGESSLLDEDSTATRECSTTVQSAPDLPQETGAGSAEEARFRGSTIDLAKLPPARRTHTSSAAYDLIPVVPGYKVLEHLGSGGMGNLYIVEPVELSGIRRVCKVLKIGRSAPTMTQVERQRREGLIMAAVSHPHVVKVHSAGALRDGRPYLVMDYAKGRTLREALHEGGRIEWHRACVWGEQIASALGAVHAQGVVHRDVKPGNVLLDERGQVLLADFGLALSPELGHMTRTGAILGTAHYFSPEQVQNAKGVGPAADLYALGVVLYELITGELPLAGKNIPHQLLLLAEQVPPPLSQLVPGLPTELVELVAQLLAKNPAARPSAADTERRLRVLRVGEPKAPAPRSSSQPSPWLRGAKLVGVGALTFLLGVALSPPADTSSPELAAASGEAPASSPSPRERRTPRPVMARLAPSARPVVAARPWTLAPGTSLRGSFVQRYSLDYPYRDARLDSELLLEWVWIVRDLSEAEISFVITIQTLKLHRDFDWPGVPGFRSDYDSRTSPPSAFQAAIGKSFHLSLERATGRVTALRGLTDIQLAIDARLSGPDERLAHRVEVFDAPESLRRALRLVLETLPAQQAGTWLAPLPSGSPLLQAKQAEESGHLRWPVLGDCAAKFRLEEEDPGTFDLAWEGSEEAQAAPYPFVDEGQTWAATHELWRAVRGRARYSDSVLRTASHEESWRCDYRFDLGPQVRRPLKPTRSTWSVSFALHPEDLREETRVGKR